MDCGAKIYVSGHNGLVGSAIVRCLLRHGYNNLILKTHKELDLISQAQVQDFFTEFQPDYVFHAAGLVGGILANSSFPAQYIYDNLMIATNVIHSAYQNHTRKLLFFGSSSIYPRASLQPIKEEYLLTGELEQTNEAYALAKIAGLKMGQFYRKQYGCDFITCLPTNLYGPNDHYHPENSHVLPALIRKLHLANCWQKEQLDAVAKDLGREYKVESEEGLKHILAGFGISKIKGKVVLTLWGSGAPFREFMFVDDLAEAVLFLMDNYSASQPVNIGTGLDASIKDMAYLIKEIVGFTGEIQWDISKPDGIPKKQLDVSLLTSLGFSAPTKLREGIIATYEDYLSR
ncbi:MAG: GDP-L-fucose synthase [Candidatus Cloacimonetes bacterium]|nr:GDP-L-fucose synthase [Candidatus Cloacimonadota bacterium]